MTTSTDDYTVVETVAAEGGKLRRLRAHDGSGDWFMLSEVKRALRKPKLKTRGEYRTLKIWYGPSAGYRTYRLIRPAAVMSYAREYSERPAAWWRQALHLQHEEST